MKFIDTHCHLNFDRFDDDVDQVVERARNAGVTKMVTIGCHVKDAQKTIPIAKQYDGVFPAVGIHPTDVSDTFDDDFAIIQSLAHEHNVLAIGETGLDFYRPENPSKDAQLHSLFLHLELARELDIPLIFHSRNAYQETLEAVQKFGGHPFVIHCFAYDMAFAEQIFACGGMVSFTGTITFPKSEAVQNVAQNAPLDRIMIETDSPFLAPVPQRGKRCEPAFVVHTAQKIADLRGISLERVAEITTKNAEAFFGI